MKIPEDPFVRELLPEFVETWIQDIESQLPELFRTKNDTEIYRLAHTIKGSCLQFGLDASAEIGIKLMGFTKNKDWENMKILGDQLIESFYEIRKFLQEQGLM